MDKVLEIGHYAAGYFGRLAARLGADVVRIEPPVRQPAWVSDQAMDLFLHAGKRRVCTTDRALMAELAARADVVVCEADTADALLELGFDDWHSAVKVALTPFGRTGPRRNWQATPNVLLAMGGYTHIVGDPDKAPLTVPGHYVEFQAGALAHGAAGACRLARESNVIDVSMLEVVMTLHHFTTIRWLSTGDARARHGSDLWYVVPANLFACRDGWVCILVGPNFWDAFTLLLDRPELLVDERFANNDLRMQHRDALFEIIQEVFLELTRAELERRAAEFRIPLGLVMGPEEVLADSHLAQRDAWETLATETGSAVLSPTLPFRLDGTPVANLALSGVIEAAALGEW